MRSLVKSRMENRFRVIHFFRVVFVELRLSSVTSPEAEDFRLGAVSHVDNAFEPPSFHDGSTDGSKDQSIFADLQESKIATGVRANLDSETVTVHLAGSEWLQVDIVASLQRF